MKKAITKNTKNDEKQRQRIVRCDRNLHRIAKDKNYGSNLGFGIVVEIPNSNAVYKMIKDYSFSDLVIFECTYSDNKCIMKKVGNLSDTNLPSDFVNELETSFTTTTIKGREFEIPTYLLSLYNEYITYFQTLFENSCNRNLKWLQKIEDAEKLLLSMIS